MAQSALKVTSVGQEVEEHLAGFSSIALGVPLSQNTSNYRVPDRIYIQLPPDHPFMQLIEEFVLEYILKSAAL